MFFSLYRRKSFTEVLLHIKIRDKMKSQAKEEKKENFLFHLILSKIMVLKQVKVMKNGIKKINQKLFQFYFHNSKKFIHLQPQKTR
jgi:hypothetical protein